MIGAVDKPVIYRQCVNAGARPLSSIRIVSMLESWKRILAFINSPFVLATTEEMYYTMMPNPILMIMIRNMHVTMNKHIFMMPSKSYSQGGYAESEILYRPCFCAAFSSHPAVVFAVPTLPQRDKVDVPTRGSARR